MDEDVSKDVKLVDVKVGRVTTRVLGPQEGLLKQRESKT